MYRIRKQFTFSASHHLYNLPPDHPCSRIHGHNYTIELVLASPSLNMKGFVRDYRELDEFKNYVADKLDHRDLNEVFEGMQTSAENLARKLFTWCYERWPIIETVRVSETSKTWAEYTEEEHALDT